MYHWATERPASAAYAGVARTFAGKIGQNNPSLRWDGAVAQVAWYGRGAHRFGFLIDHGNGLAGAADFTNDQHSTSVFVIVRVLGHLAVEVFVGGESKRQLGPSAPSQ